MSSSHRSSHHHSSSSKGKGSSSKSRSSKDDWSDITDPEERRRVQNRIAQRKFRDKARETKERQDRDAENQARAGHSYHTPDPGEMGTEDELSGLPWGSLSLKHVVRKSRDKESESRPSSRRGEDRREEERSSNEAYESRGYEASGGSSYYQGEPSGYYDEEGNYYDYGSHSGSGYTSR